VLIIDCIPEDRGWSPIRYMVSLAAELLGADVLSVDHRHPSTAGKLLAIARGRNKAGAEGELCLMICAAPGDFLKLLRIHNWRRRFRVLAAWVIDSFWLDHIPIFTRLNNPFDHFFVTSLEDVVGWNEMTGVPTTWLPWGTDALRLGSGAQQRPWDVTRVGRQPPQWEDDFAVAAAAKPLGIAYQGRPQSGNLTTLENQRLLMSVYGSSKYVLAFSNSVNREKWTHPTRQYLTGRWVDSLACGAVVAGVAPRSESTEELLWPGATLELGGIERDPGLQVLASAIKQWTAATALRNSATALRKLDWRWRFRVVCETFGVRSTQLDAELVQLQERANDIERGNSTP
jgi:hypothetical protein